MAAKKAKNLILYFIGGVFLCLYSVSAGQAFPVGNIACIMAHKVILRSGCAYPSRTVLSFLHLLRFLQKIRIIQV